MQIIQKSALSENSLIAASLPLIDYSDCYLGRFYTLHPVSLDSFVPSAFHNLPDWSAFLMRIRNMIVKPFGLKTDSINDFGNNHVIPAMSVMKGDKLGLFEVIERNDEEVVMFLSDKHLDVCLAIMLTQFNNQYELTISTAVQFNNALGHIYFFAIKPFHILIVRSMLKRMIRPYTI